MKKRAVIYLILVVIGGSATFTTDAFFKKLKRGFEKKIIKPTEKTFKKVKRQAKKTTRKIEREVKKQVEKAAKLSPIDLGVLGIPGIPISNKNALTTGQIRRAELQQASKWIEEFVTDKTAPVIFGGDLNIEAKPGPQKSITDTFPTGVILYNPEKSAHTGTVWDVEHKKVVDKRIDWLIILRNPGNRLSGDAWIVDWFGPHHTDHLGYFGEFSLQKK